MVLKNMGPCNFDPELLAFAGDPAQQTACLLTPVQKLGKLGPPLSALPAILAQHVGQILDLADRDALGAVLQERGLDVTLGATLSQPLAQAHDGDPAAPYAGYFVIHDTSSPNFRGRPWPKDIDSDASINNLNRYVCANKIEGAHVFINRGGAILVGHDLSVPWRATKFEMAVQFGTALKGLFLHVELIQPRRREPGRGRTNDFQAPVPGFTPAQYDALALVYVVASVRAGRWLIPAFHAVIDEGIRNKHDDPQNFELQAFAHSLETLMGRLDKRAPAAAAAKSVP
ncbi:MAG: hypothetical protein M3R18_08690 [Pseudomonadota bacterium]|nr:hypothetical protein [Pseudomonadota bacterium]